jgi:hypothetical protein
MNTPVKERGRGIKSAIEKAMHVVTFGCIVYT